MRSFFSPWLKTNISRTAHKRVVGRRGERRRSRRRAVEVESEAKTQRTKERRKKEKKYRKKLNSSACMSKNKTFEKTQNVMKEQERKEDARRSQPRSWLGKKKSAF